MSDEVSNLHAKPSAAKGSGLTRFHPDAALVADVRADARIELAQRARDWPLLERAVDEKIGNLRDLVIWWDANVQRQGGDRQSKKHSAREKSRPDKGHGHELPAGGKFKVPNVPPSGRMR